MEGAGANHAPQEDSSMKDATEADAPLSPARDRAIEEHALLDEASAALVVRGIANLAAARNRGARMAGRGRGTGKHP